MKSVRATHHCNFREIREETVKQAQQILHKHLKSTTHCSKLHLTHFCATNLTYK